MADATGAPSVIRSVRRLGVSRAMTKKFKVALAVIGCAASLVVAVTPSLMRARSIAKCNACLNHQAQIEGAKQMWGIKNHKTTNDVPTWADLAANHLYLKKMLVCPAGGDYTLGKLDERVRCSIATHNVEP